MKSTTDNRHELRYTDTESPVWRRSGPEWIIGELLVSLDIGASDMYPVLEGQGPWRTFTLRGSDVVNTHFQAKESG